MRTIFLHLIVSATLSLHPGIKPTERAIQAQVNTQLVQRWSVLPIKWGSAGIPVYVLPPSRPGLINHWCGGHGYTGCHWYDGRTSRIAIIGNSPSWSVALSHEVIETMVNPQISRLTNSGQSIEACDPVENYTYLMDGISVSDFVFPRWFFPGAPGGLDQMGVLR